MHAGTCDFTLGEGEPTEHLPIVAVEWLDSSMRSGWTPMPECRDDRALLHCISVGILIVDRDDMVAVAPHIGDDPAQADGVMYIPRVAVQRITHLVPNGPYVPGSGGDTRERGDPCGGGGADSCPA